MEKLKENLGEDNEKAKNLDTEVEQLKNKILNAEIDRVAKYKQSKEYENVVAMLLLHYWQKKRLK